MYFYYKLDISYNSTNHNGMYLSAKIKDEINFDEIIQNAKKYNSRNKLGAKLNGSTNVEWKDYCLLK